MAIKLLADNWIHEPDVRARFRQEAVLLRRVRTDHPNAPLLDVYDIDETTDGHPYFVMRLADRGSLADRTFGRPWPLEAALSVVDVLEQALTTLHRAGIVHRDVKPSNLLITATNTSTEPPAADTGRLVGPDERVVLGDLGLAKDLLVSGSALTIAGGTPRFMAPEQRDPAAAIDHRADLFAATAVVAELVTGAPTIPSADDNMAAEAIALFEIGLATDPAARFATAADWAAAMRQALSKPPRTDQTTLGSPLAPPTFPATGAPAAPAIASPTPRLVVLATSAVVGAVLLAIVLFTAVRGGDDTIVGPDNVQVGETVSLTADVEPDDRYTWRVGGREVADRDLELTSDRAGFIEVELVVTSADGSIEETTKRVTVTE